MKGLLYTYLLTAGGSCASFINPFYGLLVYISFAIVKPDMLWSYSVPAGNYSRIVAAAMFCGWLMHGGGKWKLGQGRAILGLLVSYWLWCIAGAATASNQFVAWKFVDALTKIVLPILVGMTTITTTRQLRQLAWCLALSQGYVAFEMNLHYFSGFNMLRDVGIAGMDNNSAAIGIVTGLGIAFFLGMSTHGLFKKCLAFGMAACLAHAVLFSFSRGGMIAMSVSGIVGFLIIKKRPSHYLVFALAVVLVLQAAGDDVRARFMTTFQSGSNREASAQSRLDLWIDCFDLIQKHPIFGIGPNHWPLVAHTYGWEAGKEAHSLWVQLAAEIGLIGTALLAGYYCLTVWRLFWMGRRLEPDDDPFFADLGRMVITAITGFVVSAQFVSLEDLEIPYYTGLLGAAGLSVYSRLQREKTRELIDISYVDTAQTEESTERLSA